MPISGLILITEPDTPAESLRPALESLEAVTVGPADGSKLAIVTETPDQLADKLLWRRLMALPGVCHIDVAYIQFDETENQASGSISHYGALQ
jgi:nitrate reductase NapAB chaperone NapD